MGTPKTPSVPDPAKTYEQGIETNIKYAPQEAAAEQKLRNTYDPLDVQHTLGLQQQYGGQALNMYQGYLKGIDPQGQAIRSELGADVSSDLAAGTNLTAGQTREDNQAIRSAEAARGQTMGNAAVSAEALNTANEAQAMYQQRLTNAGSFVQQDNTIQQLTQTAGLVDAATTPDRTDAYVNPNAGTQGQNAALAYYQSALQGGAAGGGNPWTSALASAGAQVAGRYAVPAAQSVYGSLSSLGGYSSDATQLGLTAANGFSASDTDDIIGAANVDG